MSVRKWRRTLPTGRISERWVVDIKYRHEDGTEERVRKFPRLQTKAAAERLERATFARLERGESCVAARFEAPVAPVTLDEFWLEFVATHVVPNNRPSERAAKEMIFRQHLQPIFGQRPLASITSHDLERYKAHKLTDLGYAPKTVNNQLAVLRALLNLAKRWNVIANIPTYKELRIPPKSTRFLSKSEAASLVAAAQPPWKHMITLCLNTGIRIGELIALQWQDIDLQTTRLIVQRNAWRDHLGPPKGGKTREIALNDSAVLALKALRHSANWVFPQNNGNRMTHAICRRPLLRACELAGIAAIQWHALRHTFASQLVAAGVPLRAIQQLLGHANYATTERYAHLAPRVTVDAVNVLQYEPTTSVELSQDLKM